MNILFPSLGFLFLLPDNVLCSNCPKLSAYWDSNKWFGLIPLLFVIVNIIVCLTDYVWPNIVVMRHRTFMVINITCSDDIRCNVKEENELLRRIEVGNAGVVVNKEIWHESNSKWCTWKYQRTTSPSVKVGDVRKPALLGTAKIPHTVPEGWLLNKCHFILHVVDSCYFPSYSSH